jgi:hypothetical protein
MFVNKCEWHFQQGDLGLYQVRRYPDRNVDFVWALQNTEDNRTHRIHWGALVRQVREIPALRSGRRECLRIRLFKGAKPCRILQEQSETEVRVGLSRHKFGVERVIEGTAST